MFSSNEKISGRQAFRLLVFDLLGLGTLLIPAAVAGFCGRDGIFCIIVGTVLGLLFLRLLVYAVGEERLGRSIVRGGSSGIDCSWSKMSARTGIGKLTAEYQVVIPVPLFGIAPVKCSEKMKIKAWSGYEREGWMDTGNDTVYVTETGLVYHKDYHCSHLDLSIRMTHLELVEGLRNENGGKYYPCEHCVKGNGGNIYITNSGDRYHSSLSCSGLKRTIYAIPISEAAGKGACSRCGQ